MKGMLEFEFLIKFVNENSRKIRKRLNLKLRMWVRVSTADTLEYKSSAVDKLEHLEIL